MKYIRFKKNFCKTAGAANNRSFIVGDERQRIYAGVSWPVFKELIK